MKKILLVFNMLLVIATAFAQPGKKPGTKEKSPTPSEMDKAMEEAMKGMSKEEQEEMKKLMKGIMPALAEQNAKTADYPEFSNNKQLIPKKDVARIALVSKKIPAPGTIATLAGGLYTKIMTKGSVAETNIVKQVLAKTTNASDIHAAAILAMMQGHPEAAMALAMKAVQADPTNNNYQNNMAALLTQYGYPEQAIPVLQKLKQQSPANSTVLNNLAHAWLGLGETDSVKRYASLAMRVNPAHPEASMCGGLMQELMGDPVKASEYYQASMDQAPNPFTEALLKNAGKNQGADIPDWEKIRQSIAKSAMAAMPNASLGFGLSNTIAQPGKGGAFAKTANGSITPGNINTDMELVPITKIEKDWDLTPLPNIPLDDLVPLPDLSKRRYAKQLLEKMLTADCSGVRNSKDILKDEMEKMMKSIKELEAHEELLNEIKKFGEDVEEMEAEMEKKGQLKEKIEKFQQEVDKLDKYDQFQESKKNMERLIKELDAMDDGKMVKDKISKFQALVDEMDNAPAALKDIQQNGVQTTISSGVQAPGTFTSVKGLFN